MFVCVCVCASVPLWCVRASASECVCVICVCVCVSVWFVCVHSCVHAMARVFVCAQSIFVIPICASFFVCVFFFLVYLCYLVVHFWSCLRLLAKLFNGVPLRTSFGLRRYFEVDIDKTLTDILGQGNVYIPVPLFPLFHFFIWLCNLPDAS